MPFRYRCATVGCYFDHFSPAIATAHESEDGHNCESYTVEVDDGYTWDGQKLQEESK